MVSSGHEKSMELATSSLPAPFLTRQEVQCGAVLGKGSFCKVSAVDSINLKEILQTDEQEVSLNNVEKCAKSDNWNVTSQLQLAEDRGAQEEARKQLASRDQSSFPRLAMKELKYKSENDTQAKNDLDMELRILKKIRGFHHPHIIELFAIGIESFEEDARPTFLILSKMRATLSNFLYSWRERRGVGLFERLGIGTQQFRDLWLERFLVLSKITSALQFLHSQRIIYRDLKPENIGFDADNVPKLFDFGLAKEIDKTKYDEINDTYQLTGCTGTLRYSPPEVNLEKPYGMSVDVYSLSIVMYEVLSLHKPFVDIPPSLFEQRVFIEGARPPIDEAWPKPLQKLLSLMWDENPKSRPQSCNVYASLEDMMRGSDEDLFPSTISLSKQF